MAESSRKSGPYGAGESCHGSDTEVSHGQPKASGLVAYGSPPACCTQPWHAYEYASSLPNGRNGSSGTIHSPTVSSAHRVDGTTRRPVHHAYSSSTSPISQHAGKSTPCSPSNRRTRVTLSPRTKPEPPRYALIAVSTLPQRPR